MPCHIKYDVRLSARMVSAPAGDTNYPVLHPENQAATGTGIDDDVLATGL